MTQRKVFGKQSRSNHDSFASMLYSSPDARLSTEPRTTAGYGKQPSTKPHRSTHTVLQPIDINTVVPVVSHPPILHTKVSQADRKVKPANETAHNHRKAEQKSKTKPDNSISPDTFLPKGRHVILESAASPKSYRHKSCHRSVTRTDQSKSCNETRPSPPDNDSKNVSTSSCPYANHCATLTALFEQEIEDFSAWATQLSQHLAVSKIAEASFGEVYRLSHKRVAEDTAAIIPSHEESVLKIIALTPPECTIPTTKRERNRAMKKIVLMSKPADVASEIRLLQRMSSIPGYTDFREMRILKGRPSGTFAKAYKAFNKCQQANGKDPSTFPDPSKKSSYPEDQLWAVIEMQDAGTDLERLVEQGVCKDIWTVWDVFWQVTLALAKGEESAQFEHRDLHLGNICVRSKDTYAELDIKKKLGFTKLNTTLIDYTISRATMLSDELNRTEAVAYFDLANDQHIFSGDSAEEYQYDIYRYMRSALLFDDALAVYDTEQQSRSWSQFHPQTNLVWLHFVLFTLLQQMSYSSKRKAPSRKDRREYERWKRADELERSLLHVRDLLEPQSVIKNGMTSASILVGRALEQGWLNAEDVIGVDESTVLVEDLNQPFAALNMNESMASSSLHKS